MHEWVSTMKRFSDFREGNSYPTADKLGKVNLFGREIRRGPESPDLGDQNVIRLD